jgi:hypothetical protein
MRVREPTTRNACEEFMFIGKQRLEPDSAEISDKYEPLDWNTCLVPSTQGKLAGDFVKGCESETRGEFEYRRLEASVTK